MGFWKKLRNGFVLTCLIVSAPKRCSAPVMPANDRIITHALQGKKPKDILIIDQFKNNINIDLNPKSDISHGFITSKILEDGLPDANIHKKNLNFSYTKNNVQWLKDSLIAPLFKEMRSGKKYDAVNLSFGKTMSFEDLSEQMGKTITRENLAKNKREVKDYLLTHPETTIAKDYWVFKTKAKDLMGFVDCMDSLSARGTKVYVGAGNGGKEVFNVLSLIDNSITVGAVDSVGAKTYYTCDNSLVNRWEKGALPFKKTENGYQIKFDKSVKNIDKKNTTSFWHHSPIRNLQGTSYACPRAIVADFK